VRAEQFHDEPVERADAGQRVALNLAGVAVRDVARGDALAAPGALEPAQVLDCDLVLRGARHGMRAQVHHGTREAPARLAELGDGLWQARLERPLLARAGDRVVVRSIAPPDTMGGGVVLDAAARRHGRRADVIARLERRRRGEPEPEAPQPRPAAVEALAPQPLSASAVALEERLRAAGHEPPNAADLDPDDLAALRAAGRAVRVGRSMYAHPDALADVRARVEALIDADGSITLARLRDELQTSRKFAQAHLEHLDAERVTKRLPDDSRVLRRSAAG
jgi:selenocysteine-specific elongation factor